MQPSTTAALSLSGVQWADRGGFEMSIERLRWLLKLEHKYKRFRDFRRAVIDQAQEELDETSNVMFRYTVKRKGRTPVAVKVKVIWRRGREAKLLPEAQAAVDTGDANVDLWWTGHDPEEQSRRLSVARAEARRRFPDLTEEAMEKKIKDMLRFQYLAQIGRQCRPGTAGASPI